MNKQLLISTLMLATAGTAGAMQTNQNGLVTNFNGPAKVNSNGKTGVMTAVLPDGRTFRLDPSIVWSVNNGFLTRVTPVAPAPVVAAPKAPAAKQAPVAPVVAAPKARLNPAQVNAVNAVVAALTPAQAPNAKQQLAPVVAPAAKQQPAPAPAPAPAAKQQPIPAGHPGYVRQMGNYLAQLLGLGQAKPAAQPAPAANQPAPAPAPAPAPSAKQQPAPAPAPAANVQADLDALLADLQGWAPAAQPAPAANQPATN